MKEKQNQLPLSSANPQTPCCWLITLGWRSCTQNQTCWAHQTPTSHWDQLLFCKTHPVEKPKNQHTFKQHPRNKTCVCNFSHFFSLIAIERDPSKRSVCLFVANSLVPQHTTHAGVDHKQGQRQIIRAHKRRRRRRASVAAGGFAQSVLMMRRRNRRFRWNGAGHG